VLLVPGIQANSITVFPTLFVDVVVRVMMEITHIQTPTPCEDMSCNWRLQYQPPYASIYVESEETPRSLQARTRTCSTSPSPQPHKWYSYWLIAELSVSAASGLLSNNNIVYLETHM
jgi:hypothetical protein